MKKIGMVGIFLHIFIRLKGKGEGIFPGARVSLISFSLCHLMGMGRNKRAVIATLHSLPTFFFFFLATLSTSKTWMRRRMNSTAKQQRKLQRGLLDYVSHNLATHQF